MLTLFQSTSMLTNQKSVNIANLDNPKLDGKIKSQSTFKLLVNIAPLANLYVDSLLKVSQHYCQLRQEGYA